MIKMKNKYEIEEILTIQKCAAKIDYIMLSKYEVDKDHIELDMTDFEGVALYLGSSITTGQDVINGHSLLTVNIEASVKLMSSFLIALLNIMNSSNIESLSKNLSDEKDYFLSNIKSDDEYNFIDHNLKFDSDRKTYYAGVIENFFINGIGTTKDEYVEIVGQATDILTNSLDNE